jgi:hypothetical protein
MPTLVFAKQFLDDFATLQPAVRQKVRELPDKFENAATSGVHLEKLNAQEDDRVRTVRVDQFWRGVVVRLGEGRYALLRVLGHDKAIDWAKRQKFAVNPVTGIVEILDVPTVEEHVDALVATEPAPAVDAGLFDALRDRDFMSVGIDSALVPVLRKLNTEDELLSIASYLPEAQADAVLLLAGGKSTDEVWQEIQESYAVKTGEEVDPDDIDTALDRPASRASFVVTTSDDELLKLLSGDFEAWRTFLHPTQQTLAYRPVYNGPAKITGGAGTGKTVVLMHRARFLAQQLVESDRPGRVVVGTYTTALAKNLSRALSTFCTPEQQRRLHVTTVDALARQVLAAEEVKLRPVDSDELRDIAEEAAGMAGLDALGVEHRFLIAEWQQVVLAKNINTLPEYAMTPRPGRGRRLSRGERKDVWNAIERLTGELASRRRATWVQIAAMAAEQLTGRDAGLYVHAVVDEAQDLHPAQWRLLRACVPVGANDLFIAGDAHQRIYDHRVSLSSIGIETRGRSRRLKINYRTSQSILAVAQGILRGEKVDDLDGELDTEVGYRSAFNGPAPEIERFTTPAEEAEHVADVLQEWLAADVSPSAVGVVARIGRLLEPIQAELTRRDIAWSNIDETEPTGVRLSTMHSAKGLEFARLAVMGVNHDALPLPIAVTPEAEDKTQHDFDVLRERCLLYVACTRARDELLVTGSGAPSTLLPG